ncbi:hypothetical protein [Brevibacterium litoralis]|uniref:hypothetical protein n=1 Tax=Brevibacterium litoralis TaxID=3138935 RepID=UPI0032F097AA
MNVTAPACMDAPRDDDAALLGRSRTLSTQAETVGTTLTTFEQQSAGAMDAMSSTRAQQLFYYVGKATSMLSASQETAAGASTALSDFASDVSDVKEVLETTREKWVDLEYDRRAIDQAYQTWEGMRSLTPPSPDGESPAPGSSTGSGTGTPTLAPPDPWVSPLNPLPVAVSLTRTGSLLGLPTVIDSTNHWSAINQIDLAQEGLVTQAEEEQERYRTAVSGATEAFDGLYVELDPVEVLFDARQHELELYSVRTGLTLPEMGYDTPEEQWQWLLGEGLALREHERRYGEFAAAGYATATEQDLVDAGELDPSALDDGRHTPGTVSGSSPQEDGWEDLARQHGLEEVIGDIAEQYPHLMGHDGLPHTDPYAPVDPTTGDPVPADAQVLPHTPEEIFAMTPAEQWAHGYWPGPPWSIPENHRADVADLEAAVPDPIVPGTDPVDGTTATVSAPVDEPFNWQQAVSSGRYLHRFWFDKDARVWRVGRHLQDLQAVRGGTPVDPAHLRPLNGTTWTTFHSPTDAFARPLYDGLVTGKRPVPSVNPGTWTVTYDPNTRITAHIPNPAVRAHLPHLQEGVGTTSAVSASPDGPRWRNVASAVDVNAFRTLGVLGVVNDAQTVWNGSNYEGFRGDVDRAMAGVGLASGVAGLASSAGLVTLGTVAAPVTVVAATAAGAWALGNYLYDNAEQWDDDIDDAQAAVDDWMDDHRGNEFVQFAGNTANGAMAVAEGGLKAVDWTGDRLGEATDWAGDRLSDVGDALTFWD